MSELGDLLELIHGATNRVGSVQATLAERCRPQLLEAAFRRFGEHTGFARGGGYFFAPLGGVAAGEQADEHAWEIRLWVDAGRFRQERVGPDLESVLVVDHERWWTWAPAYGVHSHEDEAGVTHRGGLDLLDAAEFVGDCELELAGQTHIAGRPAKSVRVRAARGGAHPGGLSLGIEEATLEIDAERGLVLRRIEFEGGQPAFVREVEEITYDEPLSPDRFVFTPPAGSASREQLEPRVTSLDESAALASFPVWKLAEVPRDWRVEALFAPARERPTWPDSVTLLYSRRDGGERLEIQQRTREHDLPVVGPERRFERDGRHYIALGPARPVGREAAVLIFAAGSTQIRMSSSTLSLERILELAVTLAEAY
jgi:hypothetical protein